MRRDNSTLLRVWVVLLATSCGAPPLVQQPPPVDPAADVVAPDTTQAQALGEASAVRIFDGTIRAESLRLVSDGSRSVFAFDTDDGEVWLGAVPAPEGWSTHELVPELGLLRVAGRASVGCLAMASDGRTALATVERDAALPTSGLVLRRFDADGELEADPWAPATALWADPAGACAFVGDVGGDDFGVLLRARAAQVDAVLDLWLLTSTDAVALGTGTHVPSIRSAVSLPRAALVVLEQIEQAADNSKRRRWTLARIELGGTLTTMGPARTDETPLALASDGVNAQLAWLQTGLPGSPELVESAQLSVLSVSAPLAEATLLGSRTPTRSDVFRYVAREREPLLSFVHGRWWALCAPEAFTLHNRQDPAPYRELVIALDEGRSTPLAAPADLYRLQLAESSAGVVAVAHGAGASTEPELADGVFIALGADPLGMPASER